VGTEEARCSWTTLVEVVRRVLDPSSACQSVLTSAHLLPPSSANNLPENSPYDMKTCAAPPRTTLALGVVAVALSPGLLTTWGAGLVHLYEFNGTMNDSIGGVALIDNGGTIGAGSLAFGANQGPTFWGEASVNANYSIGLRFSFETVTGYRKIIDFKNRTQDSGQYVLSGEPRFYPVGGGGAVSADTPVDLVVTRDAATSSYSVYLNGSTTPVFSFNDGSGLAVALFGGQTVFHFFRDDLVNGGEASAGVVSEIRIWDRPLSPGEIPTAFAPVPEPTRFVLCAGLGLTCFGLYRRHASGRAAARPQA
jgi:hypothetical protein